MTRRGRCVPDGAGHRRFLGPRGAALANRLGPALRGAAVKKQNGKVRMVKVRLSTATRLSQASCGCSPPPRSTPSGRGQPVDGFQGALPPQPVEEFVSKLAALAGGEEGDGLAEAVEAADTMLARAMPPAPPRSSPPSCRRMARTRPPMPVSCVSYSRARRGRPGRGDPERRARLDHRNPPNWRPHRAAILSLARQAANAGPRPGLRPPWSVGGRSARTTRPATTLPRRCFCPSGDIEGASGPELLDLFRARPRVERRCCKTSF